MGVGVLPLRQAGELGAPGRAYGRSAAPAHQEEPDEAAGASGSDVVSMPPC